MARESWYKSWREAYMDLHAAYLAVLRVRHQRNKSLQLVIQKDMEREDPFGMKSASGKDAVQHWIGIWGRHAGKDEKMQVLSACTEAINNHWNSWKAFMDLCPPQLRKFKSTCRKASSLPRQPCRAGRWRSALRYSPRHGN